MVIEGSEYTCIDLSRKKNAVVQMQENEKRTELLGLAEQTILDLKIANEVCLALADTLSLALEVQQSINDTLRIARNELKQFILKDQGKDKESFERFSVVVESRDNLLKNNKKLKKGNVFWKILSGVGGALSAYLGGKVAKFW